MILKALLAGDEIGYFNTNEVSSQEVGNLIQLVTYENPEVMFYNGALIWSNGKIEFKYKKATPDLLANQAALQSEVSDVLSSIIKPGFSDFDKIKAVHDYLALHIAYDYDNFKVNTVPPDSYTAYGALINGIAVCDGYTKAAQLLLNKLDIENHYVVGYGNGELHSWNLVKLDGQYYFMDVTWDDPVPDKPGNVRYNYFLVTSKQLAKDHSWEKAEWPAATSEKYAYYNDFGKMIEVGDTYYYSNTSDNDTLYRIQKDGANKQQISYDRAPYFALAGEWIYYSNYSYGGYLFKMKKDGSSPTQLNKNHSIDVRLEGNFIYYFDKVTAKTEKLLIDANEEIKEDIPKIDFIGEDVKANKMWTVTFNKEVRSDSLTQENFFVTDDKGKLIPVTIVIDSADHHKVLIHAPTGGYENNHNYKLTVKHAISKNGLPLKESSIKLFYVR